MTGFKVPGLQDSSDKLPGCLVSETYNIAIDPDQVWCLLAQCQK